MMADDSTFAGSIPEIYDRYLVPLIFEPYARDLAARLASLRSRNILEVAAGTGVATRAIAAAFPSAHIVATDLNQPMLDKAAAGQRRGGHVTWQQADAQALPFESQSFDAVVCQFGAMFFPDRIKAYSEAKRVLRPGGCFLFNVWDRISENAFADVVTEALATMFPDDPPLFLARTPHGYHDAERIRMDLATAGFESIEIETLVHVSRAASAKEPAIAYCQGTPLRSEIELRKPGSLEDATQAASEALARHFGHGVVEGRIGALVITAA